MRAATCKVAQVAAQRLRPGRFERLTAKAPGFAGGYLLPSWSGAASASSHHERAVSWRMYSFRMKGVG